MEVPEQKHSFSCPGARDSGSLICVCRCGVNPVVNTGTPFSHEPEHPKHSDGVSEVARLVGGGPDDRWSPGHKGQGCRGSRFTDCAGSEQHGGPWLTPPPQEQVRGRAEKAAQEAEGRSG